MNLYARIRKIEDPQLFKRLFDTLMSAEHGEEFQSVKEWKDFGVDGYRSKAKTVYQLYCPRYPERAKLSNYKDKITADIKKLAESKHKKQVSKPIESWMFVTPDDLAIEVIEHIYVQASGQLGLEQSGALTAVNLAPLFMKHVQVHSAFPELTAGIYADKTPKLQLTFVKIRGDRWHVEIFNNGTEDVQDLIVEYNMDNEMGWRQWNDHFLYQFDDPVMGYHHTCVNLQKGERQYIGNLMNAGGFKMRAHCVGVESGKTFVLEQDFPRRK